MPVTTTFYARQRHELEVAAHSWKPEVGGDVVTLDLDVVGYHGHLSVTLTPDQWLEVIGAVTRHLDVPQTEPAEVTS